MLLHTLLDRTTGSSRRTESTFQNRGLTLPQYWSDHGLTLPDRFCFSFIAFFDVIPDNNCVHLILSHNNVNLDDDNNDA